jgi:pentatricopeptide repeat protein
VDGSEKLLFDNYHYNSRLLRLHTRLVEKFQTHDFRYNRREFRTRDFRYNRVFNSTLHHPLFYIQERFIYMVSMGIAIKFLNSFNRWNFSGIKPDNITLVGVLSACSHAGLVDEGWRYFVSMST